MSTQHAYPLRLVNVHKAFGPRHIIKGIHLDIAAGEFVAIVGRSGCGKSTLLRLLAQLDDVSDGQIVSFDHSDTERLAATRLMFQDARLLPWKTVLENVGLGLDGDWKPRAYKALADVGLAERAHDWPSSLSGGQKQRVALARALIHQPKVLLLDEPLGALDKKLREATQIELVNIIEKVGVTCVMVTHDQEEAMTMASRIAVMSEGSLLQVGTPTEVYETPRTEFVADFIGNVNLFKNGQIVVDDDQHVEIQTDEALHVMDYPIPGEKGTVLSVAIRPEKMDLSRTPPAHRGNQCYGEVVEVVYFGSDTLYHVRLEGSKRVIKVQYENTERYAGDKFTWGDKVYVSWPAGAIVPVMPSY